MKKAKRKAGTRGKEKDRTKSNPVDLNKNIRGKKRLPGCLGWIEQMLDPETGRFVSVRRFCVGTYSPNCPGKH